MTNPYKVLGVSEQATPEEIKKKYKTLCGKYHPDKGGDEAKFKEVQTAYSKITEPHKHERPQHNPFSGFQFNAFHQVKVKVDLTIEEAFRGTSKTVQVPHLNQGINVAIQAGTQHLDTMQFTVQGQDKIFIIDLWCSLIKHPVFTLDGNDVKITKTLPLLDFYKDNELLITDIEGKDFKLKFPANSNPGTQLRLKGKGFIHQGRRGNLIVTVNVELPILSSEQFIKLGELLNVDN